ncbi:uncharacterized protein LOC131073227 isoform X3 [Cryptomeria japonica]|uniref:uncharacterized protein LOC131073227 isoform X3 n=1 Tax=Cryptomeria japonica TaxID=3369 RepID=UPI0027DA9D52|nr:uncharacterized protein LOC131073227 isoform X3 [Cryptomeria japonica]
MGVELKLHFSVCLRSSTSWRVGRFVLRMGMGIPVTVFLLAVMLFTYIRFPQFVEDPCTPKKHFDLKQWFLSLFNHANKRQFAYQIVSILWKGTLLEGCIGSRRSMNGVFPNVCRSCGMFNGFSASDASIMNSPQSSLISRMPNSELDRRDLVWNCESCTFENEVFVPVCEICGAPNLMFD